MSEPWDIMQEWIKKRIRMVATEHTWHTNTDHPLYKWAWAVENHEHARMQHWTEPPIPIGLGYIAQIASSPANASDPDDSVGEIESETIGLAAATLHGDPQAWHTVPDYPPGSFDPIAILEDWITGRIKHAADPTKNDWWSKKLTDWTDCIQTAGGADFHLEPPTPLSLGYIVHAGCNYNNVADPDTAGGAASLNLMGVTIAVLDERIDPWMECDEVALDADALAFERTLRRIRVPAHNKSRVARALKDARKPSVTEPA